MTTYFRKLVLLGTLLLFSFGVILKAQETESIFDKMNYPEVLNVSITTDIAAISDKRSKEKQNAILSFVDENGINHDWDIKLAVRGKFRRMRCTQIPPLKIFFDKVDLKEEGLAKFNDLKLVNQCIDEGGKELLLKEYLAYELYSNLTEESFRVQFLNITYIDSKTKEETILPGFIIEDTAELRARIDAKKVEQKRGFTANQFNIAQFRNMALFQYWIGNSDWSAIFGRNIKVLEKNGQLIAIPYDFDFSGMVDAPYAIPNTNFGLASVKQRAYLGFEKDVSQLESAINNLIDKRADLKKVVKKQSMLSWGSRNETWSYLNAYFEEPTAIAFGVEVSHKPVQTKSPAISQSRTGK